MAKIRSIIAVLAVLGLLLPGSLFGAAVRAQEAASPAAGADYRDPAGRFTVPVPTNWLVEEHDGYIVFRSPDGDLTVAALVVPAADAGDGVIAAWRILDPAFDPAAVTPQRAEIPSGPGIDQTVVLAYDLGQTSGRVAQGVGQRVGNQVYVLIVRGDVDTATRRQSQISIIGSGFRILAVAAIDLSGRAPLPLAGEQRQVFEQFVTDTLAAFQVPSASVVVVHGGQIVYAHGFGVAEQGGNQPVTPDTLMMVGSVTKSFTTMLMGTLVDAGLLAWDEPVVNILPSFKVADPAITPKITLRDLVCACTGVPRRDLELLFNADELTAEGVITSLAGFAFSTPIGEAFQYSNQMVAAGGYIAALAAGGHYGDLLAAYRAALQQRVLDPIGMPRSTFDLAAAAADPDHASPHGATLAGGYAAMPLGTESWGRPIDPAGGLWSSANELARYLITELQRGVGPDGNRVISAENLEATWQPRIAISAQSSYGLGWVSEDWNGLRIISHDGNTEGFTSDVAFLPGADLGIAVLTNAQSANTVASGIRQRLLELLYDQPSQVEPRIAYTLDQLKQSVAQLNEQIGGPVAPELAHTLTGDYQNAILGPVTVGYVDGDLVVDAGEFRTSLIPVRGASATAPVFITADPPAAGAIIRFDTSGPAPRLVIGSPPEEYVFERVPSGATPIASPTT